MATKRKKKHGKKKKHGGAHRKAHHSTHRSHPRRSKKKKHHRCTYCGHSAKHGAAGCLHHDGKGRFCSCKHRSARA